MLALNFPPRSIPRQAAPMRSREATCLEVVDRPRTLLDEPEPRCDGTSRREQRIAVADRSGHDKRPAIDAGKTERDLGRVSQQSLGTGMTSTVQGHLEIKACAEHGVSAEHQHWMDGNCGDRK